MTSTSVPDNVIDELQAMVTMPVIGLTVCPGFLLCVPGLAMVVVPALVLGVLALVVGLVVAVVLALLLLARGVVRLVARTVRTTTSRAAAPRLPSPAHRAVIMR